jgi:hypothetical protein
VADRALRLAQQREPFAGAAGGLERVTGESGCEE